MTSEPTDEAPFEPTWESLRGHQIPRWFRDAKFGIWAHWGPQSVAMEGDWYARHLYGPYEGTEDFERERAARATRLHRERFGHPSEFGHKDICDRWRAELFDPEALIAFYRRVGARYFVSMAAHCDNFDLWDSRHQPWNAVNVGPRSNILGRWSEAARSAGLRFGISMHAGSWTWRWLDSAFGSDTEGTLAGVPYDGHLTRADGAGRWWEGLDPVDLYGRPRRHGEPPDAEFVADFYARLDDVTSRYQPELVYLDDTRLPFDEGSVCPASPASRAGLEYLAGYYNACHRRTGGAAQGIATIKTVPDTDRTAVMLDVERGQRDAIDPYPWQFDTSVGDWFYRTGEPYKSARQIIQLLVDTVSKNGCLLLNVMQRPDGTLDEQTVAILEEIAAWTAGAGEAIFESRPWRIHGEGPTKVGTAREADLPYTGGDVRFTRRGDAVYALLMAWPSDRLAVIRALGTGAGHLDNAVSGVSLLGTTEPVRWRQDEDALRVWLPEKPATPHVHALRVR